MSRLGRVLVGLALIALLVWPLIRLVSLAVGGRADASVVGLSDPPRGVGLAAETARLVGLVLAMVLPVGAALSFVAARTDAAGRGAVGLIYLGLFVPLPLQALVWLGSFGNLGRSQALGGGPWLVGLWGAAVVHAVAALPWVILVGERAWWAVEPALEEAARLEMAPWRAWWATTLRRSLPGLVASGVLVAAWTAGEMTVTDLIPIRTYAEEVYTLAQQGWEPAGLAVRMIAPQLAVVVPLVAGLGMWLTAVESGGRVVPDAVRWRWRLGTWRWPVGLATVVISIVLVALPAYGLIWRAGRVASGEGGLVWSWEGLWGSLRGAWLDLTDPELAWYRAPLWGSVVWSTVAATGAVVWAWSLAWLGRKSRFWRVLTIGALGLVLAVPAPLVGLMLKLAYVGVAWMNTTPVLMIVSQVVRGLPFALLVLGPAVRAVPEAWVEAAALEGLGPAGQVVRVGLRATGRMVGVAWLICFGLALGELPAVYFTRAPGYEPVAGLVWSLLHMGVESRLAAMGLILAGCSVAVGVLAAGVAVWAGSGRR